MRNSRIPWLGEIPAHWEEVRLRFLVDGIEQGWSPQADSQAPSDDEWGVLKLSAVSKGTFEPAAAKALPSELKPRVEYEVKAGDFLVTRANTPSLVGDACFVEATRPMLMLCDLIYRLRLRRGRIHGKYLVYFLTLPIGRTQIESDARGTSNSMVKISQEHIKSWRVPAPPIEEQVAIADYLDAETARIDALIAAKENLLAILAEKRRAVITQAVTRGLDPSVPMRDSGVPWLGEIPAHWEEVRIRFLVDGIEQGWSPQADSREPTDNEWGVLKLSAVSRGTFDPTSAKAMPPELDPRTEYEVKVGDFLLTRANTPSLVGDACFVAATRPMLMLCDLIYRLRLRRDRIHGTYLAYFLTLPIGRTQIEADARGTSNSMVKISQEHIKSWRVPAPPVEEQVAIAEFLGREVDALDRMERATLRTVQLLRERREAVIAAAVTGQLDVEA